jgi:replicative DNA helicase
MEEQEKQVSIQDTITRQQAELEQAFAGAVLINGDYARRKAGWLNPETILTNSVREFWARVQAGEEPVEVSFSMNMGAEFLKWSQMVTSHLDIEKYANSLTEKNYLRVGMDSAKGMATSADAGDVMKMREYAQAFLARTDYGGTTSMRSPMDIAMSLNGRIVKGDISIPWGIDSLDAVTRGLERGTLTVLGARPSMGKSSLAFQCNEHQAIEQGLKVAVFALEMSGEQMFARRTCHKVDAMWMDVRAGLISREQEDTLQELVLEYAQKLEGKLYVNDSTDTTCADIVRIQQREQFDVIMIDHLGLLKDRKLSGERHDQYLGRLTEQLHSLAKETNCVVILLAQLNRGVEARTDKKPHMGDLRDSGNIEQNADNVVLMYGEWYYDPSADNTTELVMGKFRDGVKNHNAFVRFNMADQQFESVEQVELDTMAEQAMDNQSQMELPDDIPF